VRVAGHPDERHEADHDGPRDRRALRAQLVDRALDDLGLVLQQQDGGADVIVAVCSS